ncbi:hypothetical protein ANN_02660 [Periplaneta americana]|uniref:HAT C-terminal dimerisation domain-containing protein n=1 Tax=Periplaneta americana TaxID=6978 RepID=A0ABQ8U1B8_PERAM|nr:hypothetical protein ANN_02660 [Periplaneta americana]
MSPGSNNESYPEFAHIVLRENPGKNLNQVTCPNRESNPDHLASRSDALAVTPQEKTPQKSTTFSTEQLTAFVQAPLTSCDVERSFSRYKAMLRDNMRRMTTENIRHCLVVNCNSIIGAFSNEASTSKSIDLTYEFIRSVLFCDEATFHLSGKVNKHNLRIWGLENPRTYVELDYRLDVCRVIKRGHIQHL